jgi:hypothetical protein
VRQRGERTKEFSVINSNFYQEQKFGFWGDVCKAAEERKARWRALSSDINEVVSGTRDRCALACLDPDRMYLHKAGGGLLTWLAQIDVGAEGDAGAHQEQR